jgi:hypothetical protein
MDAWIVACEDFRTDAEPSSPNRGDVQPSRRDQVRRVDGSSCRRDREARAQAARRQGLLGLSRPLVRGGWTRAQPDVRLARRCQGVRGQGAHPQALRRAGGARRGTETFADFASEWWELYAKPNLDRATLTYFASVFNQHLLPRIGHMRLRDLNVPTLMRLRADLEADGVGRQAVRKSLAVLQSIHQRAVEWERIGSIRRARYGSRRCGATRRSRRSCPRRLSGSERHLIDRGRVRDATLVSVLTYAGVRPQEAVALRWRNVRKNTLLIEQAVTDGELKAPEDGPAAEDCDATRVPARGPCRLSNRAAARKP